MKLRSILLIILFLLILFSQFSNPPVLESSTTPVINSQAVQHSPMRRQARANLGYGIVYVRQPRWGDDEHVVWPEAFYPGRAEPGADLMLLRSDGSEEVLVPGENGAVTTRSS